MRLLPPSPPVSEQLFHRKSRSDFQVLRIFRMHFEFNRCVGQVCFLVFLIIVGEKKNTETTEKRTATTVCQFTT